MSLKEYQTAIELMQSHPDLQDFVGPRPISLIEKAEQSLGLKFPTTYRQFLLEYGAGSFGAAEFYGVINDDFAESSVPDAIWYTLMERKEVQLPYNLIVIQGSGMGDLFCLECPDNNQESAIISYQPGYRPDEQNREIIASDFGGFFLHNIREQLSFFS